MAQTIVMLLAAAIVLPAGAFFISERRGAGGAKRFKSMMRINVASFFGVLIVGSALLLSNDVAAAELSAASAAEGMAYLSAALSIGASCVGAGIAVSAAASAALGALSENESIMGKAMIFVALAEGVAIYGLIIAIMILGKIG
jgi:V/A-type H+-transporting ATPase subunit K